MGVLTIEGIVDNGQIKLPADIHLPEHAKVYVIVPDMKIEQTVHLFSPRLKNPNQAAEFEMEISAESSDANIDFGMPELSDEALVQCAEESFLELDTRESREDQP